MSRSQMSVALASLLLPTLAAGVDVRNDAVASTGPRKLQTTVLGVETTDLGCFKTRGRRRGEFLSERFEKSFACQIDLSPDGCATLCLGEDASFKYYGLTGGDECWCGAEDTTFEGFATKDPTRCSMACTGDASLTCGGRRGVHIFELGDEVELEDEVDPVMRVDLVPCILSSAAIDDNSAGLYMMHLFFQGYWTSKTEEHVVSTTDNLTPLLVDVSDTTMPHGKCNAVYVGFGPSEDQSAALSAYSAQFKVRIVFFESSLTHTNRAYQAKLGIETYFDGPIMTPSFIQLSDVGGEKVSVTQKDLQTNPNTSDTPLWSCPVLLTGDAVEGVVEVLAEYSDESGTPIIAGSNSDQTNAAMLTYAGTDGHEELHVFFSMGWFDAGSWAWAHYVHEWATKGIFMGERRFYLGAVVDDLFLSTAEFEYDGEENEAAVYQRCTGEDLANLLTVQQALNTQYPGSEVITEFAMNGGGIADKVSSSVDNIPYVPNYEKTTVTTKGKLWFEDDHEDVHDTNWLADNVPRMQEDMDSGVWEANDDLLAEVVKHLDTPSTFFHQHHTLIHLFRDQLRSSDCFTEDTGNVQIALMTGMWDSDNYNWRSMVSPGITGLFNKNCLESAAANLMTCYPGDNTYDGTVEDAAVLINKDSQFHSIYTTESGNGYDGAQIVPRFATYVYFNCVSGDCLVKENEYIRRSVCECTPLDPNIAEYTCTSTADECLDANNNTEIQSFGSIESLFATEAATTTRYLLTGRRDKYMFHQANIKPAGDVGDGTQSLLDYWYE
ncbi:unnamed protein product, partial [Pylaiella littoralis]